MRNTLQYLYSILVFFGALTTSYLMISQSELRNQTRTAQTINSKDTYRREAAFDTAVTKLFEMENALSQVPDSDVRMPAVDSESNASLVRKGAGKKLRIGERSGEESRAGDFDLFK